MREGAEIRAGASARWVGGRVGQGGSTPCEEIGLGARPWGRDAMFLASSFL